MMGDLISLHPSPVASSHYREIRSFTDAQGVDDLRVVLASEDERPGIVHVMLIGEGACEVLDTFRDSDAGRGLAKVVGEAADKAVFYSRFYGDDS